MHQWTDDERRVLAQLDTQRIPRHVAIIMDGNGRWARQRHQPRVLGHQRGIVTVRRIARACDELGIGYLTLYAFSEENWQRPAHEVRALMSLLALYLVKDRRELMKNRVSLRTIGNLERLPARARRSLEKTMAMTADNDGLILTLALSYGGRDEIVRAVKQIVASHASEEEITAETFSRWLDTRDTPDPDLLIRTSGEMRISNFLLWQLAYTELVVTNTLWPDFSVLNFLECISDYQKRDRRFGRVHGSQHPLQREDADPAPETL